MKAAAIPKKSGGKRILGVPTVANRIAQTVVKLRVEPVIDPLFHQDSYGYRLRKSAQQALAVSRKRCWQYPYVLEFNIVKLFDSIDHVLLLKALRYHGISRELQIYVERWLTVPTQHEDGLLEKRVLGTPQGGVVSLLLANLFLHYAFDAWMERVFLAIPFCRYADDGLIHCRSLEEAQRVLVALTARLRICKLTIHPAKTHIVCCVPGMQRSVGAEHEFSFLEHTFRLRCCTDSTGQKNRTGFVLAMSRSAEKSVRRGMKEFPFVRKRFLSF